MYEVFKPKSELLKKYISEITILKETSSYPKEYFAFPHNVNSIVFFKDTEIKYSNHYLEINRAPNKNGCVVAIGKYVEPLRVKYNDFVHEIAVNFTSTGINYFFDERFEGMAQSPIQVLNNAQLKEFAIVLFDTNEKERVIEVERFFEDRFMPKDLQLIEKIIGIVENDTLVKFKDISTALNISVRNINRLFHKYVDCSPKDYKKIIRFRSAISDYNKEDFNLTEICLKNEYYDSPHFTREFKKLTKMSPKKYFKHLTFESKNKYPYIFK
jgi:AraC-like DNA-binding protein